MVCYETESDLLVISSLEINSALKREIEADLYLFFRTHLLCLVLCTPYTIHTYFGHYDNKQLSALFAMRTARLYPAINPALLNCHLHRL